jgi:hypothetical protein
MLRTITSKYGVIQMLLPKPLPPYAEVWHLRTAIIPRRSITGRLLWGTVLRRWDNNRWIYKKYAESVDAKEHHASVRALFKECKKTATRAGRGLQS